MDTPIDLFFTLQISLQDDEMPLESRIEVPGLIPLSILDEYLQNLFEIEVDDVPLFRFGDETVEADAEPDPWLQDKVSAGDSFEWIFEIGEHGRFTLRVESLHAAPGRAWEPVCLVAPNHAELDSSYLDLLHSERFLLPFYGEMFDFLDPDVRWSSLSLSEIMNQAERWAPVLTEALRRITEEPEDYIRCEAYTFPTAVLLLLAGMHATRAAEILRRLAALEDEIRNPLSWALAEMDPGEGWGRILATLHIDDPSALIAFSRQDGLSKDIREASLTALGMLLREKLITREEREVGLGEAFHELGDTDLEMIINVFDDFTKIMGAPIEDFDSDWPSPVLPEPLEGYVRNGTYLSPLLREQPKVGRNDSCPCGSGKKYKKCCGC